MREYVLGVAVLSALTLQISATEAYRNGTSWVVMETGDPQPGDTSLPKHCITYTLFGMDESEENPVFEIQRRDEDSLEEICSGYIRKEGDKIYYKETSETDEWRTIYDFGLKPEETAVVYGFGRWESLVKCVEINPDLSNPGWDIMYMEEYYEPTPATEDQPAANGEWIRGISSTQGLLTNVFAFEGGGSRLEKVVNGEEVIWEAAKSGIESTVKEMPAYIISSENGVIKIRGVERGLPLKVISLDGKTLVSRETTDSSFVIPSLMPGTYVVRVGEIKEKVIVGE